MKTLPMLSLLCGLATLAPVVLCAQTEVADNQSGGTQTMERNASDALSAPGSTRGGSTDPNARSTATDYVPALDGTGLIAMDHSIHTRLLYGVNYSGGYDSNPDDLAKGPSSGTFLFSPFAGIEADHGTVQYVVQYQPTFRRYTEDQYQGGSLHTASLKVTGTVNERWVWDVHAQGSHGLDSIRLLSPQQNIAVGDVPGTGPVSASYRPDAGTLTYIDGAVSMKYNASERDTISATLGNSFSHYSSLSGDSNIAQGTIAYTHSVTPHFQWINYGQSARYYGVIHCFTYGGGVGFEWKPQPHSYLQFSIGPQVDTSGCGGQQQGFAYNTSFSQRLTDKSQFYVTSARQPASPVLGPGLWQKTVSLGLQHDFDHTQSAGVDFGYVGTSSLQGVMGYSGTYVDAGYNHRFPHNINAALNYRRYAGDWTTTSFVRNTALVSVSWTPSAGHVFQ